MAKNNRNICIFGSTGSIGTNALSVIDNLRSRGIEFNVVCLTAGKNIEKLSEQVKKYSPKTVVIEDHNAYEEFKSRYSIDGLEILSGTVEIVNIAREGTYDLAISSLSGMSGLSPTLSALESGRDVALANKETLVSAGHLVNELTHKSGAKVYPIDSEHSAILQCLIGEDKGSVSKVVLTASGGPFLESSIQEMKTATIDGALNHPNWKMGKKITIDSATMMNKGLEVIEAKWLYDLDPDQIDVIIHPQSIVHSFVEFKDGSVKAQLGVPDMRIPIQYALTYPAREHSDFPRIDFRTLNSLEFRQPDLEKFRCLEFAYRSLELGRSYPAVVNSSNEAAVGLFLEGKIGFMQIPEIIEEQLMKHGGEDLKNSESIIELSKSIFAEINGTYSYA